MVGSILIIYEGLRISGSTLLYTKHLFPRYDYRIKYLNLKKARSLNALSLEDVHRLWIPFLVFDNTEENEATKVESTICLIYAYTFMLRVQKTQS